jgi:membrane protein required for colicin V production
MDNLNAVDGLVLLIFGLSIIFGLMRGFVKEAISLASWIAAAIVASTFASPLARHFSGVSTAAQTTVGSAMSLGNSVSLMTLAICFVVLFIGTLFIGSIIGYILSGAVSMTGLGFLNRILGAAFGFARGYLMVIIFMFVAELTPMGSQQAWAQSTFVQQFQPTVVWFAGLVNPELAQLKALGTSAVQKLGGSATQGYSSVMQGISK